MPDTITTIATRAARRLLAARVCESAAVWAVAAGLVAAGVQVVALATSAGAMWQWQAPGILLACGAIVGAVRALLAGASRLEAAAVVDSSRGLAERFATAVELAQSNRRDEPVAAECCRQALAALGDRPLAEVSFWRRTRRTAAALGLVVAGVAALAMLASVRSSPAASLAGMDGSRRQQLAAELRRGSAADGRQRVRQALAAAAVAVEIMDEDELARLLDELRAQGVALVELTPEEVRRVLALADEPATDGGEADGPPATTAAADANAGEDAGGGVTVYDPLFDASAAEAGEPTSPDAAAIGPAVRYEDAWDRARQRAMASLRAGDVPPAYRGIVRRYFAER